MKTLCDYSKGHTLALALLLFAFPADVKAQEELLSLRVSHLPPLEFICYLFNRRIKP